MPRMNPDAIEMHCGKDRRCRAAERHLAFGPDGALYVTAFGDPDETNSAGVLLRITGDL